MSAVHQVLPQAESPAGCPEPCPTPALCPSPAPSVPLPLLLGWAHPSQTSWALTLPGTVPGAALPLPPSPCPVTPPLCSAAAVPCQECPLCVSPAAGQHSQAEGAAVAIGNTSCTSLPPQPHRSPRCPPLALLAAQLGINTALRVHFWFCCPYPTLRAKLSIWGASRQAMTHSVGLVASVPWHKCHPPRYNPTQGDWRQNQLSFSLPSCAARGIDKSTDDLTSPKANMRLFILSLLRH